MSGYRFDYWTVLSKADAVLARDMLHGAGKSLIAPDLPIAPDGGEPYLLRWHLVKTPQACVYFHIQLRSDPERPLHNHPWDSTSVILAGGYEEMICYNPHAEPDHRDTVNLIRRRPGDHIPRSRIVAHRLLLPADVPYSMSLFTTGPKRQSWGFYYDHGFVDYKDVTKMVDGRSVHIHGGME